MPPDPERALALSYAAEPLRPAMAALFALDETLGQVLRTTRESLVGQMRLTWWHSALCALDETPPPAQPVLQALAETVVSRGVAGAALAGLVDGWEILLEPDPLDRAMLTAYAERRGALLFTLAGQLLGADARDPLATAGQGWALADLARHSREASAGVLPRELGREALNGAFPRRWSRAARPLGALALLARMDLELDVDAAPPIGSPRRIARLAWHRISGR